MTYVKLATIGFERADIENLIDAINIAENEGWHKTFGGKFDEDAMTSLRDLLVDAIGETWPDPGPAGRPE